MITKISVIGTMENGETKTASVSVKGRVFRSKDCQLLYEKVKQIIEKDVKEFRDIRVCLEMKKNQKSKPYKSSLLYDRNLENANFLEAIISMVMVMDYEMAVGRFKDCSL